MTRTLLDNNAIENSSIKLIKLNEDITSILDKIKDLTFTTTIDNSSSDSQFPSAKAVYDQVELLYNSISSTNNVISGIQTVLTQLNTKINTNASNISDNSTAITTLDNKVNTEVANINTELNTLTDNLSALSTTVTNNYASLNNLINTNVESLNNTITANHTEFTEFVNTHNTEYNDLVTRVNNLGENVAGIQSNINTIKSDINTITTNLTALTTKVGTIESNLTTLSSDVEYFDINVTLGVASDDYNYDATLDKTYTEILSALSNNKKKIRVLLNGETFYPTNIIVGSNNSIMFRCLYNSELIMVSSNNDNTAIVSLLPYLNTSNIITSPYNTYEDTNVLSASLADKINYYLVNITSIENLSLVTGYTNYYSGTCTLDKTFNELLEAINNKYNIQIYFPLYSSYCKVSTYVKDNSVIELSFILDRAFFKISYIKSTNKITIIQYNISDVTNSISNDNSNAISSGAVYNLKIDLESKISSINTDIGNLPTNYVTTDTEQTITGIKNFNGAIKIGMFSITSYTDNIPALTNFGGRGFWLGHPNNTSDRSQCVIYSGGDLKLNCGSSDGMYLNSWGGTMYLDASSTYLSDRKTELNSTIANLLTRLKAVEDKLNEILIEI